MSRSLIPEVATLRYDLISDMTAVLNLKSDVDKSPIQSTCKCVNFIN